ncbi:hypothetical protein P3W85_10955 [Cupriavidus basilensis]|uniref:Pentapeptide MXKDX repeat protein n=1 Tax=Cupriavidus basilensis TaxID=68895 RepID=A0ABT6ALJ8_9BURK|nr:hypothetical protein [Cupriavidus basilensis]MDF3833463.1 hypothetical protein [Cupriavidus basilensis]
MKKWIVMLSLAMFGAGAYAQASAPAAPAAGTDKPAASKSDKMSKKHARKKRNHAPADADKMMNKGV